LLFRSRPVNIRPNQKQKEYKPFKYRGAADADRVIIAMASVCQTAEETVDYLVEKGEKVGLITVHLYRPFSEKYFFNVLPKTVKKIAVLERTKEPGAPGEPLLLDVKSIFYDKENDEVYIVPLNFGYSNMDNKRIPATVIWYNPDDENIKEAFEICLKIIYLTSTGFKF